MIDGSFNCCFTFVDDSSGTVEQSDGVNARASTTRQNSPIVQGACD